MRNSEYILCNCPMLDTTYNHTVDFVSRETQLGWFMSKRIFTISDVQYHRKNMEYIIVGKPIMELDLVNYVLTINPDTRKPYFYFVVDREYMSENSTALILQLDVIQTYLFDINFAQFTSLIDREHCNRWDSNGDLPNIQNLLAPEDIEIGEYIESARHTIYEYQSEGGYIVTSSEKLTARNGGSGGGGNGVANKMVSPDGFVLIKCMEAFAPVPYNIGDGTNTIGYGVTERYQPDYYNELAPQCTEQQASNVLLKVINNFSKQVYDTMKSFGKDMSTVSQQEFDAFTSLAYNAGIGGMSSTDIFVEYCNGGNKAEIAEQWLTTIIMSGSDFEQGLRDRRRRESQVFLNGVYEFKPIGIIGGGTVTNNEGKGYIPDELYQQDNNELQNNIVESARKQIGKPYVWGGNIAPLGNSQGTDCSGLIQWAFNDNDKIISRTTYTQIKEGREIPHSQVQKADLIFSNFSSIGVPEHVFLYSGMVDGNHMCVEAQQTGTNIMERSFVFTNEMRIRRLV